MNFIGSAAIKAALSQMQFAHEKTALETWSSKGSGFLRSKFYTVKSLLCFFHPDYTVGFGVSPNHAEFSVRKNQLADYTAGEEFHLALKQIANLTYRHRAISLRSTFKALDKPLGTPYYEINSIIG